MALTTVVTSGLLERLTVVLRELEKDPRVGRFTLALLVPSAVSDDFRSLVVASPGLDQLGPSQAVGIILEALRKQLGEESFRIDSVSIQRSNSSSVRHLQETFNIPELGTAYRAIGSPLIGLDDPILLVARASAKAA